MPPKDLGGGFTASSVSVKDGSPPKLAAAVGTFSPDADGTLTPSQWAANKSTDAHWLAGAAAFARWDEHSRVSAEEFEKTVAAVQKVQIGGPDKPPAKP